MPTIAEQWRQEGVEQGFEQGIALGEQIGQIWAFQTVLGREPMPLDELKKLSLQALTQITKTLEDEVDRRSVRKTAD